jgi:glyoxylase-like metal-dependent hydrolase (beta-lactamase superfamily II)
VVSEIDGVDIKYTNYLTKDEQEFYILDGNFKVKTMVVPCHTKGHQLYLIEEKDFAK